MPAPVAPSPTSGLESSHRPSLPGFSDALGHRTLVFETSSSSWLEQLRFTRAFSETPGFESALRSRIDAISTFHHPAAGTVRGLDRIGDELVLVSNNIA